MILWIRWKSLEAMVLLMITVSQRFLTAASDCRHFLISYDGIIVIPRYKYNEGLDLVLGGSVALTPEEYVQKDKVKLDDDLGNEVLQFMLQSLDGMVIVRTGHCVKPDRTNEQSLFYPS